MTGAGILVIELIVFVLALDVGHQVLRNDRAWGVAPALHSPLMSATNAISAIVVADAILAAALPTTGLRRTMDELAVDQPNEGVV
jgi:H+-translocating NAD(P) transhydrogenase subunit alpha